MNYRENVPPSGAVFRHRKTGKTKSVRYSTQSGVHWVGQHGEWKYECWERWNSWVKSAVDITMEKNDH